MRPDYRLTASSQQRASAPRLNLEVALAAALLLSGSLLSAQTAGSAPPSPAAKGPTHHHTKPTPVQTPLPQEQPAAAEPEMPHWPVNDTPAKPSISWDSKGLKINATNSSLHEILDDVSTATGAKVEGFGTDQRVFGEYGPGQARDVISQLLHGSGYNVLMIGDQGEGTPRQIILSARKAATGQGQPGVNRQAQEAPDEDVPDQPEVEEQQQLQPPMINGRQPAIPPPQGPPGAPRTPQQVLQELQQRQQQMQDQQQQQQQQPH